jgi:hypothetical protein
VSSFIVDAGVTVPDPWRYSGFPGLEVGDQDVDVRPSRRSASSLRTVRATALGEACDDSSGFATSAAAMLHRQREPLGWQHQRRLGGRVGCGESPAGAEVEVPGEEGEGDRGHHQQVGHEAERAAPPRPGGARLLTLGH